MCPASVAGGVFRIVPAGTLYRVCACDLFTCIPMTVEDSHTLDIVNLWDLAAGLAARSNWTL